MEVLLLSTNIYFYTPPHNSGGVQWFMLDMSICMSVHLSSIHSYFGFYMISKFQCIFTKLGMCIDIVGKWFGIANFVNIWQSYQPTSHPYFHFGMITWVNVNWFSQNFVCALMLCRSGFGLLISKFHQFLTLTCPAKGPYFIFRIMTHQTCNVYKYCRNLVWVY